MESCPFIKSLKHLILPKGVKHRVIKHGLFKGIRFNIDFQYQSQLYFGLFEMEVSSWLQRFSRIINTAIDIGTGNGEYTIFFLAKTNAKKVLSFDPQVESKASLWENLKLNKLEHSERLIFRQLYIGDKDENTTCTLDSIIGEIIEPCLIKMDVDGSEVDILKGANTILEEKEVYWIVETHSKELEKSCMEIFKNNGFKTVIIHNSWIRFIFPEQRPIKHNRWLVAYR